MRLREKSAMVMAAAWWLFESARAAPRHMHFPPVPWIGLEPLISPEGDVPGNRLWPMWLWSDDGLQNVEVMAKTAWRQTED